MSIKPVVIAVFILGLAACSAEAPHRDGKAGASVSLVQGEVVGIPSPYDDEITVYRGLPYAAAPIGELRWQPPQPAASGEVFGCEYLFDSCYQPRHWDYFVWRREDFPVSEDCLYLMSGRQKTHGASCHGVVPWRYSSKRSRSFLDF